MRKHLESAKARIGQAFAGLRIGVPRFLRHFLLAVQFLTRIPIPQRVATWVGFSAEMQQASMAHLPAVGALLGAFLAGVSLLVFGALPINPFAPLVVAVVGTAIGAWITGALHEDGLADTVDALGGSASRERALEIMKDSRIGSYGALGLCLVVLGKVSTLALLGAQNPTILLLALILGHTISRFWPLCIIRLLLYAGDLEKSKFAALADPMHNAVLLAGGGWTLFVILLVSLTSAALSAIPMIAILIGIIASMLAFSAMLGWFNRRLQGFTGDTLGATQQLCEWAFYLGMAISLSWS